MQGITFHLKQIIIKGIIQTINMKTYTLNNTQVTKEELQRIIKENPELLEENTELLEEKNGRWKPEDGDRYWLVNTLGTVNNSFWGNDKYDQWRYLQRNVFETEEEAQEHLDYLNALAVIRDDAGDFEPDWDDDEQEKWYGYFSTIFKKFDVRTVNSAVCIGVIHFPSKKSIQHSQKVHRKEWEIVLGVKK